MGEPIARRLRIGVDVGGTFTDLAMVDEATGRIGSHKVPSTPADPSLAIERGVRGILEEFARGAAEVAFLGHGTTVAANMVIERRGARRGMLTAKKCRDVLEIARQIRPHLYDCDVQRPAPLVPRRRRIEISERMAAEGTVLKAARRGGGRAGRDAAARRRRDLRRGVLPARLARRGA